MADMNKKPNNQRYSKGGARPQEGGERRMNVHEYGFENPQAGRQANARVTREQQERARELRIQRRKQQSLDQKKYKVKKKPSATAAPYIMTGREPSREPVKQAPVMQTPPVQPKAPPVKQRPAKRSKVRKSRDNKAYAVPVMDGIKPVDKELDAQQKQAAEIEKISRQIEEKEREKQLGITTVKEKRKKDKKEKKEKVKRERKKKSLDSHVKAERNAVRNGIFGAIAVSAALLVLAFVVYHLVSYVAEKPQSSFITEGSIEHTIGAKALVIREEEAIISNSGGELVTSVTEGSRVAASQNLAMVVPEDNKNTVNDLRNVQSQISDVQQELIADGNVGEAKKVYDSFNENLGPIIDSIRSDASTGKLQSLATYSSSLSVLLDERETALSEIDFNDERLRMLRSDEAKYQSALQKNSAVITASKPGIVSFRLDGQEGTLDFDLVASADKNEIKRMINSSVGAISAKFNIKAEENVCRIVQNDKQQLAVFLNRKDAAATDFAVGTKHDINISAEGIVIQNAEVVRCENGEDGMLIVFETTRYVEDLLDMRTVDIEIVITRSSGLRVSTASLVDAELLDSSRTGFAVYFDADKNVKPESFNVGSLFNINIIPNAITASDGSSNTPESVVIPGCEVMHCEQDEKGGVLVGFAASSDFARILSIDKEFTAGYQAVFLDSTTGLGVNVDKVSTMNYRGISSIYVNNQGFVAEHRAIITDYDREFAIIIPVAGSKVPNYNTVIIVNPKSCKPNDKVV